MLVSEESRLKQSNFTTLLNNDSYHKALLTCCLEIVFYAYKMAAFTFPHVLNCFQLKPFELFKVIESVLRHFPVPVSAHIYFTTYNRLTLQMKPPKSLDKHMNRIEERILESLAWEDPTSAVFQFLKDKVKEVYSKNMTPFLYLP